MAHMYPFGVHLALDFVGIALLGLFSVLIAIAIIAWTVPDRKVAVILFTVGTICGVALLLRSLVAPPESWPLILAAYESSSGAVRGKRKLDIQSNWRAGEIRIIDWFALSRHWGVCHGMWQQDRCIRPSGRYEATGIAREILQNISSRSPPQIGSDT